MTDKPFSLPLKPIKVLHLVSHPIHYFIPLYKELSKKKEIELTVIYQSYQSSGWLYKKDYLVDINWNITFFEGYRWKRLPLSERLGIPRFFGEGIRFDIVREVACEDWDILWIHGYYLITNWVCALVQKLKGKTVMLRTEDVLFHQRTQLKKILKYLPLRVLCSLCWGLYIGKANKEYLEYYGIPDERLRRASYCVDNDYFKSQGSLLLNERKEIRQKWGIRDNNPVVLFVGRLVEEKKPLVLLEAFKKVVRERNAWLLFVGEGPLKERIQEISQKEAIPNVVTAGFLDQKELPKAYTAADIFVLPSVRDTWGLVVNEAMNFGLPVIVSSLVGCARDLVREGKNGFIFPAGDTHSLSLCLRKLIENEELRTEFGQKSKEIIEEFSIQKCADLMVSAFMESQYGTLRTASLPA
ncbi:glycosyltransferase family 4 protein [Candidatus Methylacidiphilum infernorum]|uniref:Glycosyltransferase family 4 protein n=1 Tax=Candidatus Methylacidiphilum infernorum TaxID=511746 RepID=A0ABX7PUK7_9BACT|nr:glycosyltransferase family 4 protein [Candidatus Methylacidiphilum infernorum]QSR86413.1 glycosyltransferase family 4 protein [Candidatus Methylacidiphilum infernorum]